MPLMQMTQNGFFTRLVLMVGVALTSSVPVVASAANAQQVSACVTQMTDKKLTDASSAQKVCSCVVDEQSKITAAQKTELDNWVKSGKDVRQNQTFQKISSRLKACGDGVKFNKPLR